MERIAAFAFPAALAAVLSYALTPWTAWLARRTGALDRPGTRKVHLAPIPRLGGLAVVIAVALVLALPRIPGLPLRTWAQNQLDIGLALGVLPILLASLWDDLRPLPVFPRLAAQFLGATIAASHDIVLGENVHLFGQTLSLGLLAVPISVAWLIGVTNAFNLVDGLDGLSAGLALISAVCLTGVFIVTGQFGMAGATMVLAGGLLGFLPYNVYPARIFLGDAGAHSIGFCLACFSLKGGATLSGGFAVLVPLLAVGLPVAETLLSMSRRLIRRLAGPGAAGIFAADRDHMHHRLLALGLDHRRAVLLLYGVALVLAIGGLLSIFLSSQKAGLLLFALVVAAFVGVARLGYDEFAVVRRGMVLRFYETPVLKRALFVVFVDLVMMAGAIYAAIGLKFGDWSLATSRGIFFELLALLAPLTVVTFWLRGLYRGSWRLASLDDFLNASWAVAISSGLALTLAQLLAGIPEATSLLVVYALLMLVLVNGLRVSYRVFEHRMWRLSRAGEPCLVYGAGMGGAAALRELLSNESLGLRPVGFLDDDPEKAGRALSGYPIFGPPAMLEELLNRRRIAAVVLSSKKLPGDRVEELGAVCAQRGVRLVRMEISFEELLDVPTREAS